MHIRENIEVTFDLFYAKFVVSHGYLEQLLEKKNNFLNTFLKSRILGTLQGEKGQLKGKKGQRIWNVCILIYIVKCGNKRFS